MGNDGGLIECPELEAAFGAPVLVGRHGTPRKSCKPHCGEAADSTCLREGEVVEPRVTQPFSRMKGWFTFYYNPVYEKAKKKPCIDLVVLFWKWEDVLYPKDIAEDSD